MTSYQIPFNLNKMSFNMEKVVVQILFYIEWIASMKRTELHEIWTDSTIFEWISTHKFAKLYIMGSIK
jgi:hypothetical protein